jgi:acyl-CoA reductase-like NAD-dependent aldehyde dehydrogenase
MTTSPRLSVRKTYKLYIGGAFVRSESGRVHHPDGAHGVPAVATASRKDAREAVRAARGAQPAWWGRSAYNRGQILYRVAEVIEARAAELAERIADTRAIPPRQARAEVELALECAVHFAGWTDKLSVVLGAANPVAASYVSFTTPEPAGVVALIAPDEPCLLGFVTHLAPALASGNTVVAVVSERHPLASLDLAEVLATSDVPAGVVNILSGVRSELSPVLCAHGDVDVVVDAAGVDVADVRAAAANVTRFRRAAIADYADPEATRGLEPLVRTIELKTAWHPVGL